MMKKKILITGGNGYIGQLLYQSLFSMYDLDIVHGPSSQTKPSVDLTNKDEVDQFFIGKNYDVIINCAGTKDFNFCNTNIGGTMALNCHIVENLLQKISSQCQFIQLSSDYVFAPKTQSLPVISEDYPDTPYGESKLIAEQICRIYDKNYVIVRVAGVYSINGGFLANLVDCYNKHEVFSAYSNWYYSPLYHTAFIEGVVSLIDDEVSKQTLNLVGNRVSRYDFAKEVLKQGHFDQHLLTCDTDSKHEITDRSLAVSSYFSAKHICMLSYEDAIIDAMKKVI